MPVLGVVLVLEDGAQETCSRVEAGLARAPGLALGERAGHRWPAVLEAQSAAAAESRVAELNLMPGVACVDVVYADFEDLLERGPRARAREEV